MSQVIMYRKNTIDDMLSIVGMKDNDVCNVSERERGGIFVYDKTKKNINDTGLILNGWVRQYNSDVKLEWFTTPYNETIKNIQNNHTHFTSVNDLNIDNVINTLDKITADKKSFVRNNTNILNTKFVLEYFVDGTNGSDTNDGKTINTPFKTIDKAVLASTYWNYAYSNGKLIIWVRAGEYDYSEATLNINKNYGYLQNVIISAYDNEEVVIHGSKKLDNSLFSKVNSQDTHWNRLDQNARDNIYKIDLGALGITDFGSVDSSPVELIESEIYNLARYPKINSGSNIQKFGDPTITIYGDNLNPDLSGVYTFMPNNEGGMYKKDTLVDTDTYTDVQFYLKPRANEPNGYTWLFSNSKNVAAPYEYEYFTKELPLQFSVHGEDYGYPTIVNEETVNQGFMYTREGMSSTEVGYMGNIPDNWVVEDLYVSGMFYYLWGHRVVKINSIDNVNKTFTLDSVPSYGIKIGGYKKPFFFLNVLEQLNTPGEYYIDRTNNTLYVYPKKDINLCNFKLSTNNDNVVNITGRNIILNNLIIEGSRNNLINIEGKHNLVVNCKIWKSSKNLITIDGYNNGVSYSEISYSGEKSVLLKGGDWPNLIRGNNYVSNNDMHHPGMIRMTSNGNCNISGCGNKFTHNDVHDVVHQAINYTGALHDINFNNFYRVLTMTADAGVVYAGRHWGYRGNNVNYNYFHDIKNNGYESSLQGIYFDDIMSGNYAIGNVFNAKDIRCLFTNGGSSNIFTNNIFYNAFTAFGSNDNGTRSINNTPGSSFNLLERLSNDGIDYTSGPWEAKFPELAAMPNDWDQIKDSTWLKPHSNVFENNIGKYVDIFVVESETDGTYNYFRKFENYSTTSLGIDHIYKIGIEPIEGE